MAHGLNSILERGAGAVRCKPEGKTGVGSRRIFSPHFKLQVLDSYRNDADCKGNQRATARKYGIHRRQIQKWLQVENTLRSGVKQQQQQQQQHHHHQQQQQVKSEMALNGHRQRDDDVQRSASSAGEARVPGLEPSIGGWRTYQPLHSPDDDDHAAASVAAPMDLSLKRAARASSPPSAPRAASPPPPPPPPNPASSQQCDVWDLSTNNNNKRKAAPSAAPRPVKLFKPYLDDLRESDGASPCNFSPNLPSNSFYCCQPPLAPSPELYYLNNNNNNLCCPDLIHSPDYYSVHELQPKAPFYPSYPHYYTELGPPYYEHRLDFKVDCYYRDSLCKGNPRAVAAKYHILRNEEMKSTKDRIVR